MNKFIHIYTLFCSLESLLKKIYKKGFIVTNMRCKTIFAFLFVIFLVGFVSSACTLNSARWSTASANVGGTVKLAVVSENYDSECEGETITFRIYEKDTPPNEDDYVATPNAIYGYSYPPLIGGVPISPNYETTWEVVWREDTESGESNPPEYYFIATVSGTTESVQSGLLEAIPSLICGDGICNNAETCSNCSADCGCASDKTCQNGVCVTPPSCGDGTLDAGEECDDGNNVNGDGCSSVCEVEEDLIISSDSFKFSEIGSSISSLYGISSYLKATINISFHNESLDSVFEDSLNNSIELETLLGGNLNYNYQFNDSTNKTINSYFGILEFTSANFSMPETIGNFSYQLNFSEIELFKKTVKIISFDDNSIQEEIDEKYAKLNASKEKIKKYDLTIRSILNEFLNITHLEDELKKVETQYENASTNEEYIQVLENLSSIMIPEEISETISTNQITFYPDNSIIDLYFLENTFGGDYEDNEEGYLNSIQLWNRENLTTKMKYNEILINYGFEGELILGIFQFEFDKRNMQTDAYFIVEEMEDLKFKEDYSEKEEAEYFYINLRDISNKITFSTTEDVDFLNVPAFISPALKDLMPSTIDYDSWQDKSLKWILFGLIIFLLLLVAVIVYIMLQIWYKRKYENYLFKNRNNLYNIMTYIQNSKKKEIKREEIIRNLKKAGWKGEQINYALRKYEGKKILGIIENPFKKIIKSVEKKP